MGGNVNAGATRLYPRDICGGGRAALAGNQAAAGKAMARLRQIDPELRISNLKDLLPIRRPEDFSRFKEKASEAGLPE